MQLFTSNKKHLSSAILIALLILTLISWQLLTRQNLILLNKKEQLEISVNKMQSAILQNDKNQTDPATQAKELQQLEFFAQPVPSETILLADLNRLAKEQHILLFTINQTNTDPKNWQLTAAANFHAASNFLEQLSTLPYFLRITALDLQTDPKNSTQLLKMTLTLTTDDEKKYVTKK